METQNTTPNEAWKLPETSFDAWRHLTKMDLSYSQQARHLEWVLVGYWNMDGKGTCNPSMETLIKATGIKSRSTIRKCFIELEQSGRWIIKRQTGGLKTNSYYPQFVKYPKKFNNLNVVAEREARKNLNDRFAQIDETKTAQVESIVSELESENRNDIYEATPPEQLIVGELVTLVEPTVSEREAREDGKVVTDRDRTIKDFYVAQRKEDVYGEVAKQKTRTVRSVLRYGDINKYKINGVNSQKFYVPRYINVAEEGMLGGLWIAQYGGNYSNKMTYSHISDIYHELLQDFYEADDVTFSEKLDEVHIAMCVFGSRGASVTAGRVKVMMNTTKEKLQKQDMIDMRLDYEETLKGRKLSIHLDSVGYYNDQA